MHFFFFFQIIATWGKTCDGMRKHMVEDAEFGWEESGEAFQHTAWHKVGAG